MIDLHFVCRNGDHLKSLKKAPDGKSAAFRSGFWTVSYETAEEAVGGHIYLHEAQREPAWHGGQITGWIPSDSPQFDGTIVFFFTFTGPPKVKCPGPWGMEKCIVRHDKEEN